MKSDIIELCNVEIIAKKDNKVVYKCDGHNVWTSIGREYSCLLKTYRPTGEPYRDDRIAYIGLGTGSQIESVSVDRLVNPIPFNASGAWLKRIDDVRTQFLQGTRKTSVRFSASFNTAEISFGNSTLVEISECGLFTDGLNVEPYTRGARDLTIANSTSQGPVAYHAFDPIPKTPNLEIEIIWELRH
jgi:hypothetical protein